MVSLKVTLSDDEFHRLAEAAQAAGLSVEEMVRRFSLSTAEQMATRSRFEDCRRSGNRAAGLAGLDLADQVLRNQPRAR